MPNIAMFENKLGKTIESSLSAKELAERIVIAALESEYGRNFTTSAGFAKMVNTLADSIVTNPELRRQALSVASHYLKQSDNSKKSL